MGVTHSAGFDLATEARRAAERFDACEIKLIKATFKDLCQLSGESTRIDKETFLQYFPLPGLLGERLFAVFDKKIIGEIDYEEFVSGLAITCRGSWEEKVEFIFNIYDVHGNGSVSKEQLAALLNHVPKSIMQFGKAVSMENGSGEHSSCPTLNHVEQGQLDGGAFASTDSTTVTGHRSYTNASHRHFDYFTNNDMVEQAFQECDLNHDNNLSFSEFKLWVERNPMVSQFLQSVFPYDEHRLWNGDKKHLPFIHNRDFTRSPSPPGSATGDDKEASDEEEVRNLLQRARNLTNLPEVKAGVDALLNAMDLSSNAHHTHNDGCSSCEDGGGYSLTNELGGSGMQPASPPLSPQIARVLQHQTVSKMGVLSKQGNRFRKWKQRWYVLVGNCIYYYHHQQDSYPRGVVFLTGSFIEPLAEEDNERRGYWGFKIIRNNDQHHPPRKLYARSKVERDRWLYELRHASKAVPVEEDFEIGEELGKGRFSKVCIGVNKHTLERKAVKIIEKSTLEAEEKELLRAEIAIMKLVSHPNIIRMEAVYESRENIYIVMELHSGGELFDRIVGHPRFSQDEAFGVIYPLIDSVAYLHEMGIVHRDLKPENILCGHGIGDIKIADFGLSKMVLPDQIMKMPCGTLSYVAPEVLTLNGYGKEADIWSVGTIMYLLLRGRLPFDGETREEIIECTINGRVDEEDEVWNTFSSDTQDIILGMLNKDVKQRYTAKQMLDHPWVTTRLAAMEAAERDELKPPEVIAPAVPASKNGLSVKPLPGNEVNKAARSISA
ncbi:unnamed protein product [Chrysoparadoxa australica]